MVMLLKKIKEIKLRSYYLLSQLQKKYYSAKIERGCSEQDCSSLYFGSIFEFSSEYRFHHRKDTRWPIKASQKTNYERHNSS